MIRLVWSNALKRKIRLDDLPDLAIPTWTLITQAYQAGKNEEAAALLEYTRTQEQAQVDSQVTFVDAVLTRLAGYDEEQVMLAIKQRTVPKSQAWVSTNPSPLECVQRCTELQRNHQGDIKVSEEKDRYVVRCDPCGTGGRLIRRGNYGATKKPYPWTWGKTGIPYYCIHCSLQWEIIPIELRGYPIRITIIGDKPQDPCTYLFYKSPELIPGEYFKRVGKTKGNLGAKS